MIHFIMLHEEVFKNTARIFSHYQAQYHSRQQHDCFTVITVFCCDWFINDTIASRIYVHVPMQK